MKRADLLLQFIHENGGRIHRGDIHKAVLQLVNDEALKVEFHHTGVPRRMEHHTEYDYVLTRDWATEDEPLVTCPWCLYHSMTSCCGCAGEPVTQAYAMQQLVNISEDMLEREKEKQRRGEECLTHH